MLGFPPRCKLRHRRALPGVLYSSFTILTRPAAALGGAPGLNYASDYREVDGIIFPTKRRVYAYKGNYQLVKGPLLVNIDMAEIALAE
jgi:hypothetical protein